jgi:hypothetical protein
MASPREELDSYFFNAIDSQQKNTTANIWIVALADETSSSERFEDSHLRSISMA